jgi:hypothetical protein
MKVSNINNRPNQLEEYSRVQQYYIESILQSYQSLIAIKGYELREMQNSDTFEDGIYCLRDDWDLWVKDLNKPLIILDYNHWDYSTTTGRYRNIFLNENKKLTETKIKNNTYLLANLNQ